MNHPHQDSIVKPVIAVKPDRSWQQRGALVVFGAVSLLGAGFDLWSKQVAVDALSGLPGRSMMLLEPHLELALSYNRGTAFSVVRDLGDARWLFGVLALFVVAMLLWMVVRGTGQKLEALALGMLAGGAIGNGADRVFRVLSDGGTGVVDFVKVNYPWGGSWPTFNVADSLLVVGVALLIGQWLIAARANRSSGRSSGGDQKGAQGAVQ